MARKNLGNRPDIESGVLRQRRDLYAVSIALVVFYLAGGKIGSDARLVGVFATHFDRPWVLLGALWAGWAYFLFRLSLMKSLPEGWADYVEDSHWQRGETRAAKRLARLMASSGYENEVDHVMRVGFLPQLLMSDKRRVDLSTMRPFRSDESGPKGRCDERMVPQTNFEVDDVNSGAFWAAIYGGYVRAIVYERSFSDYVLPYIVAFFAVAVALCHF